MVKEDKKNVAGASKEDGNKQQKISMFFQNQQAKGPKESKLFSSVGAMPKPKLSTNKKHDSQGQGPSVLSKHISTAEKRSTTSDKSFTSFKTVPNQSIKQKSSEIITEFVSPCKPIESVSMETGSPDIMIPDTPENERSKMCTKKKFTSSRSFLSMNANPIRRQPDPKPVKRPPPRPLEAVSVTFNNPEEKELRETKDDVINLGTANEPSKNADVTPTKCYSSDRVKRLAKSGLSPTPKRSLNLDGFHGKDNLENSPPDLHSVESNNSKLSSLQCPKSEEFKPKPDKRSNVEKIMSHMNSKKSLSCNGMSKKLTNYQLGVSKMKTEQESKSADDDILDDILGELNSKPKSGQKKKSSKIDQKPSRMGKVSECDMTEEEMALFQTLDDSFGASCKDSISDAESPSIIMPRKKNRNKTTCPPVRNIFHSNEKKDQKQQCDEQNSRSDLDHVDLKGQMSFKDSGRYSQKSNKMDVAGTPKSASSSQELCEEFEHLTPFKSKRIEGPPPPSVRPADNFSRYTVKAVSYLSDVIEMDVESDGGNTSAKKCILHGFWMDTHVAEGDTVHILADLDPSGVFHITDQSGLFVVCPDLLLSGTSVVSAVHCMRRSALNEKFRGCDDKSIHMLWGSIIHCLFQQVLKQKLVTVKQMQETATVVMQLNKFLHEMYAHNTNETVVKDEINKYIPTLRKWVEKYSALVPMTTNAASDDVKVTKIYDIEENIWSPRFGVKGKIDLTVEVQLSKERKKEKKILPLELKTGKPTFSIEHKGQVTLYSMMMSDRRSDPEEGLLLYLREPVMAAVPVKGENKRGLLQLRNELAYYVSQQVTKATIDGHVTFQYGRLPQPINSVRSCSKCPQLINCAMYQKHIENLSHHKGHAMESLVPETLRHLQETHTDYFLHWCLCLELERQVERGRKIRDIWCSSSHDRERQGDCLCGMAIRHTEMGLVTESQRFSEGDSCVITFTRHTDYQHHFPAPLHTLGFAVSDTLSISSEDGKLLVLATGFISSISDTAIEIVIDRDIFHEDRSLRNLVYRLDRCDNFNTMGYLFSNLSRLLGNQHSKEKLRQLIIEKRKPEFQLTLSKGTIEKVKPIFKSLNKPQKTVILKVLMSKDYVLIKGYPGTGKTSTIVALVRVLTSLGQSVLLTSYTHSAVDNILLKLKKHGIDFLRLGRLGRIHPDVHDHAAEVLTSCITSVHELREFYDSQTVVATSCLGTNHPLFSQRRFDVCIVDEASQVLQPACLGPLFAADKFVLVGDPKQLPPVVQSREAVELGMSESLFARLENTGSTFDLNLQYRMNKTIMHLSNELIYGGLLQCGSSSVAESCLPFDDEEGRRKAIIRSQTWMADVLASDLEKAAIFLDTHKVPAPESCDGRGMVKNVVEAEIVITIVSALVKCGVSSENIGVIAPYRHQVKHVQQHLHQCHLVGVEVNTVDQYQGRDKSVIIMSFVRSSAHSDKKSGEILQDIRRLNVAVTRAKHKLILIGDLTTLTQFKPLEKVIETMKAKEQIIALPPKAHM